MGASAPGAGYVLQESYYNSATASSAAALIGHSPYGVGTVVPPIGAVGGTAGVVGGAACAAATISASKPRFKL